MVFKAVLLHQVLPLKSCMHLCLLKYIRRGRNSRVALVLRYVHSHHFPGKFRKGNLRTVTQPGHLEYRMRIRSAASPLSVLDSSLGLTVVWSDRLWNRMVSFMLRSLKGAESLAPNEKDAMCARAPLTKMSIPANNRTPNARTVAIHYADWATPDHPHDKTFGFNVWLKWVP